MSEKPERLSWPVAIAITGGVSVLLWTLIAEASAILLGGAPSRWIAFQIGSLPIQFWYTIGLLALLALAIVRSQPDRRRKLPSPPPTPAAFKRRRRCQQ